MSQYYTIIEGTFQRSLFNIKMMTSSWHEVEVNRSQYYTKFEGLVQTCQLNITVWLCCGYKVKISQCHIVTEGIVQRLPFNIKLISRCVHEFIVFSALKGSLQLIQVISVLKSNGTEIFVTWFAPVRFHQLLFGYRVYSLLRHSDLAWNLSSIRVWTN